MAIWGKIFLLFRSLTNFMFHFYTRYFYDLWFLMYMYRGGIEVKHWPVMS